MTQNFKGDTTEVKMKAVGDPLLDLTNASLNEFNEKGFDASPFILAMYDDGRMPFSERVNRDSFVEFVKQAFETFPFSGTFEVYLSILKSLFGEESEIRFEVPDPGVLAIDIEAIPNSEFQFIGREFIGGVFEFFDMVDSDGDSLIFRGFTGIDNEYELDLLFSEIMPAGIVPDITLGFFEISDWEDDGGDLIVDDSDFGIIFVEGEG